MQLSLLRADAAVVLVAVVALVAAAADAASEADVESHKAAEIEYEHFFNNGQTKKKDDTVAKTENEVIKSKVEVLGEVLKRRVQALRNVPHQKVELVFLVDSSASVGAENFFNELKFVKKLLADFTVSTETARVAVITFSSKNRVVRHIDHMTFAMDDKHKCRLLDEELPAITYNSGGTYTLGALLEAQAVLSYARPDAVMAVFLVTDGYSNGGDPRPAARRLREQGVRIFTFGIRNGNVKELFDMASEPQQEHSYIVDSFEEFEALARRALHEDLQTGSYLPQNMTACDRLCLSGTDCCHADARCACGTHTGHYACVCPPGHYGTGLKGDCHPCPGGTYRAEGGTGDLRSCKACPDENHISEPGSSSVRDCQCPRGYEDPGDGSCQLMACPKLEPPKDGYFVKNGCNSVFNGACGIRCRAGFKLVGSSIRLCQENGTWSGESTSCVMRSCGEIRPPKNGRMECTQDDYVIDTECHFQCDSGYNLVGSRTRVCLPIGFWDGLPAFCKPVYCNPLPKLINGTLTPAKCTQAKSRYGDECSATCQEGFELRGPASRRCQDNSGWSNDETKSRCVDVTPPVISCPENQTVNAEPGENFARVSWPAPKTSDNSGVAPDLVSVPAVTEQPMKLRIGTSTITYTAQDRRGNHAECVFQVTVRDEESPTVDQCDSPPTFLLRRERRLEVAWEEPIFSDNSGRLAGVERSHDPGVFPIGDTEVTYTAWDDSGNNVSCAITISVAEHACHSPVDPIHGSANCSQEPDAVYCSLTCLDGYAFALPPRQDYFCSYDEGQWLPEINPFPFPDCSVTKHSDTVVQDGILSLSDYRSNDAGQPRDICDDPFLINSMEGQFKRRLAARLNEICGDNVVCQIDDLQAECRQAVDDEFDFDDADVGDHWVDDNEIPRSRRSAPSVDDSKTEEPPVITIRPPSSRKRTLELHFKVRGRVLTGDGSATPLPSAREALSQLLLAEMEALRTSLKEAVLQGQFDVSYGSGRHLNVTSVQFGAADKLPLRYFCSAGSVVQGDQCVLCPVGTHFNVVSETCSSCSQGSYQPDEGQLSCLVCPGNTSTKVVNAKRPDDCQAQCLAGTFSSSGLEPCTTCPVGSYQSKYAQPRCLPCPDGSTTVRRGGRRVEDCRPLCPKGTVSETGLAPVCFPCPVGYYQTLAGQHFCIRCPKASMTTLTSGASSKSECVVKSSTSSAPIDASSSGSGDSAPEVQNDAIDGVDEFEESTILEVNECFSLPCYNGATCEPLEFGFVCRCRPGFTGMQCETDMDDCASLPCAHGGTCIDGINSFTCRCAEGFAGEQCQIDVDECLSSPCQNGATCIDRVFGFQCTCQPGWSGKLCENEVDECLSDPCQNGATCVDRQANYTCNCAPGWTGKLCEEAVDACLGDPCLNGGTCEDLIGAHRCHCPAGYEGDDCSRDIDDCLAGPCAPGSTCVDRVASYLCLCPPGVLGVSCDTMVDRDFALHFSSSGKLDYVTREGLRQERLEQLTLCLWLNTDDRDNQGTPFSYATDEERNALTLTDYSGFVIYVDGHKKVTDVTANDGRWHHICVTWQSIDGRWRIYADGELRDSGAGFAVGSAVEPNGTIILGQEQDSRGGDFSNAESMIGALYGVELWSRVLDADELAAMITSCTGPTGNVLTWGDFKHGLRGGIRVEESPFCKGCRTPMPITHGDVGLSEDGSVALYSCRTGYELVEASSARRPCHVYGGWAGPEPQCRRISCGFPGYIMDGLVLPAASYSFGDTVTYDCQRGFLLVGAASRTCNERGEWTGEAPQCQPVTCPAPAAPDNGTLSSASTAEGAITTFSVGETVTFQCHTGFRLDGASTLTCTDTGQWDDTAPLCQPLACTTPPYVAHGVLTNGIAEIPTDELQAYLTPGSTLTYQCDTGFRLEDESASFISCGADGTWSGDAPRCLPVDCGPPPVVANAAPPQLDQPEENSFGATALYVCNVGHQLQGSAQLGCSERGRWVDADRRPAAEPVCVPVTCGTPPNLENGQVTADRQVYGSTADVNCNDGFGLAGPARLTCGADGAWTLADQIRCAPAACSAAPPMVHNGRTLTGVSVAALLYAQYECDHGFRLSATDTLQCQPDGQWVGEIPQCLAIECPPLPDMDGAVWRFNDGPIADDTVFYTGAVVTYSCLPGYQMDPQVEDGPVTRTCDGSAGWLPEKPLPLCHQRHCPWLENPSLGSVTVQGFGQGDTAVYECQAGYHPVGANNVRTCTELGSWSDEPPVCKEVVCDVPTAPANGDVVYTSLTQGSKVLYQCNDGFLLVGSQWGTCGEDGVWTSPPVCQPRECELPDIIRNGYIGFDVAGTRKFLVGANVYYDCEEGYEVVGVRIRYCLPTGEWSDEEPYCKLIHCAEPPKTFKHGTIIGNDTAYLSTLQFECDAGYELLGEQQITCDEEGEWSETWPECQARVCPHPGLVAHATTTLKQLDAELDASVYHYGDVLTYSCAPGYRLNGKTHRTCLKDGSWSFKNPTCARVTCQAAPIPTNGYTSRILTDPSGSRTEDSEDGQRLVVSGRTIQFGCKAGFRLVGSSLAKCLDSGRWDVSAPSCLPVKCRPPPKLRRGAHTQSTRTEFDVSDQVQYSCDAGFRLRGDSSALCTASGVWSVGAPASCQRAVCPPAEAPTDGSVTPIYPSDEELDDGFDSNDPLPIALMYRCDPGFSLVGATSVTCTSTGRWSAATPSCVAWPCAEPPFPENASSGVTRVTADAILVTVTCDPTYRLRDPSANVLSCDAAGHWTSAGGSVDCLPVLCADPGPPPPYLKYVSRPSYRVGDRIDLGCVEGFRLNDTSRTAITCGDDGLWDGEFAECVPVRCPELTNPASGRARYSDGGGRRVRSRVTFTCDAGFVLAGAAELTCLVDGHWSHDGAVPLCRAPSCADPEPVENADITVRGNKVGDTVGYSCRPGYHLMGAGERTCGANGRWSDAEPVCDAVVCPVPTPPENGSWRVGGFTPGDTIRFECHPAFTLVGSPLLTCLDNQQWTDLPPTCQQVTCPALVNPDHGVVHIVRMTAVPVSADTSLSLNVTYGYRSEAKYECDEGYQLFGTDKRICTVDGTWSDRSPHCKRIWCPELQPPAHGFVMGTGRQFGDRVRLGCTAGYRIEGAEESLCQASGAWTVTESHCQALTCEAPVDTDQGLVPEVDSEASTTTWPVGSQVLLRCRPGHVGTGDLTATCQTNRQWSVPKGKCVARQCSKPTVRGGTAIRVGPSVPASGGAFRYGDRIAVSCQPGKRLRSSGGGGSGPGASSSGSVLMTCLADGLWSTAAPTCESVCDSHCLNGGRCGASTLSQRCTCPAGYSGDRCQHVHCILPCLHGGTCVAPYTCACRPGRTGPRCEKPVCDPPCMHGARCVSPNTCQCPQRSRGRICRQLSHLIKG